MKKYNLATLAITVIASALWFTACDEEHDVIRPNSKYDTTTTKPGIGGTVSIGNNLYGLSQVDWTKEWWKYVMNFDCARNPLNQPEVATEPKQVGKVVFLFGANEGFPVKSIEISRNQALLVPIINTLSTYPCASGLKPKPGQSLNQFLLATADASIDQAANFRVELDGNRIEITDEHRIPTNLFYFKGNKDLARCIDPCVTGQVQSAVSDGYWLFLNRLTPGGHVLVIHAEVPGTGDVVDITYKILVR